MKIVYPGEPATLAARGSRLTGPVEHCDLIDFRGVRRFPAAGN